MSELRLQYQLSNGVWVDCNDRTDEFLHLCRANNGPDVTGKIVPRFRATRDLTDAEAVEALLAGAELRNDAADWYSNCRCGNAYERKMAERRAARPAIKMVKCSCGHTVPSHSVMSASLGSSCPDCYDRMSD